MKSQLNNALAFFQVVAIITNLSTFLSAKLLSFFTTTKFFFYPDVLLTLYTLNITVMHKLFPIILIALSLSLTACRHSNANTSDTQSQPVVLSDDASGFVSINDVVPGVILEIRYFSTYNFVGSRIDGYDAPVALCTRQAADALAVADSLLRLQGYRLKIFDAYRPQKAVDHFVRWAHDVADTAMKPFFYSDVDKRNLFALDYIALHSGHSRGSTFDLTLFDQRSGREVDMGGTFDFFGERSHPDYDDITAQQKANRQILRDAMTAAGFKPLYTEWWHFTLRNEPYPDTYFTFPVSLSALR